MNLETAMGRVRALEFINRAAGANFATCAEDAQAIKLVLDELLRVRQRAKDLGLLNLLAEHRGLDDFPAPPPTEPNLPDEDPPR